MSDKSVSLKNPIHCLALGLGLGCAPFAPGTFGTLLGVLFFYLISDLSEFAYAACVIGSFLLGVYLCGKTAEDLGVHDHPSIVWDEVVGYLVALWLAPAGWFWIILGFLLFRFFDIVKPWPINWLDQQVSGGFGIMIDDVIAGAYAAGVLLVLEVCLVG